MSELLMQVSTNVEQMERCIQEIFNNASQASSVSAQVVDLAHDTDYTMRKLSCASVDINKVIELITAKRSGTGHAVEAIGNINRTVSQIGGLQDNIAEAVRVQSSSVQVILSIIGDATKKSTAGL